jgi:N12 class adenine-specific DNA methylase
MPIFEYNGKKYNVRDEHIDSFMKDFPDASTVMEREGKKYRVKSADYRTFMSEQQQPEQPALDSTPETPVTPTAEEKPLTEQDKIRFSANIGQMQRRTEQMMDGFSEQMETMREYHENAPLGGGQTAEGKMKFNSESGKLEKTYITPLGNRYTSKGLADMESFRYRQAADMSVSGQLRRARLKLAELQEKRDASAKRVHEQWEEDTKKNTAPLGFLLAADTYVPRQMSDKENSTLDVAIRQTEEFIKDLEEQKDREQGVDVGFWRGFGRVAGDFRTWDFGMSDMRDAFTMMNADDLKGENATEGEREAYNEMMGALYNKGQAEQMYGGNAGFWNRAGMMTGHMPAFMLDFGITGGGFKGINVLSKAGTKAATKVVGKETVEQMAEQGFKTYVKNNGVKGLGQYATNWTIKALGTTADDLLLRAPLMTNTVQAGKTTTGIIDKKLGDVVVDENGNYDFSNDKTWGNAIWQGEADAIVENYSEMFGSHLDPVVTLGNMSKLANVVGAKRIGAVLSKADAGALNGIMGQTHQLFNKMGVSDYFGEVTEEYYGQLWRTMLNLDDAYQQNPDGTRTNLLAIGQFHGDIWGGMALSMGLMGAGKATLSGAQYASMKHGVNKADARVTELLGKEIWEPLRATIDLTTNDDIGSVAEGIVNDKDFSDDERAAVLTYMERSLMMRGFNLGTLAQKRGGEQDEDVQSMNESYIDGYNLADPQEMTDAKNMRDYQRQRVSAIVDENTLGFLDIHPMNALEEMRNNGLWRESELETVLDYLNAKQVYDGMIQRVRDDIDARVEQSNAMVDARTNRTTGMIQGATMKQDDRRVYVVSGNLVQYADGSGIDNQASDGSLIVRDAETGALEWASPDAVLNIDEPLNPSDEKMTAEEAIIQQFAQEASDKIDGVVTFNPGDTYTITGDDAQIQVQIVANEDGIVDNGDGTVNVSDGVNIFPLAKETIQQQADAANLARVAQFEQQRTIENAKRKQEMQEADRPQYAKDNLLTIRGENGNIIRGNVVSNANEDEQYEVYTETPINGKKVSLLSRKELDDMVESMADENGNILWERGKDSPSNIEPTARNKGNNYAENIPENDNNAPQNIPAMQRIPKDEQGNPLYEQVDSDTAWDAIVEEAEGDEEVATEIVSDIVKEHEAVVNAKQKALKKAQDAKPEAKKGSTLPTMGERIAAKKAAKEAITTAQQELEQANAALAAWKKIAFTPLRRKQESEMERRRIADEAAALRKAEEEKLRVEREEAERIEREALNGVPDMVDDKPQDARARGYRRVNGHKVDRQEPIQALHGKDVSVKFSDDVLVGGRAAVIDANQLQPSHIQGVRNPLHFIDEAQPKERNDEASLLSSRKIAGNIRPEEITSSVTAYTGAPTVNARGEVIQGNNRSDALRQMWAAHSEQAETYKQYLKDHADEFGLQAEDIDGMKHPVLVNMVDVDDAEAINLGQYVAQDTESGGIERIKPKNIMQKMGNDMRSFANLLLASSDEEISFAGLVDANGTNVLKWMMQKGYITPTQYSSAFDSKGNLAAEAKNDLRGIMYQSIFKGGSVRLEEMFNALPVKAQKAILATAFRDYDSPSAERMAQEIQNSIRAYYALSQDKLFTEAKNFKEARMAVESWKRQYQIDDATGESYLPADNFSNFALLLAAMYKGSSQGFMQGMFAEIYDLVQGTQETTLFEEPDNTPRTLAEAINEAVNKRNELLYENEKFEYDGQRRSDVLAGGSAQSQRGQQGSRGDNQTGKRTENGNWAADSGRRIEESDEQRSTIGGNNKRIEADSESKQARYTLSEKKSGNGEYFYQDENGNIDLADIPQEVFDEIGYTKAPFRLTPGMMLHMIERHGKELGISSTDEAVSFVLDVMNNFDHVRLGYDGALIFSIENGRKRTGKRAITILINSDNGKFYGLKTSGYESIGGLNKRPMLWERGAKDVSSSTDAASASVPTGKSPLSGEQSGSASHQSTGLLEGSVIWRTPKDATTSSVERQGLDYEQSIKTETATKDSGITPQSTSSDSKGTNNSVKSSELGEKIAAAEAEVNVNPTEAQKEAGNYKKGHVQVGVFDITIEQPKGSVRSGVDANGNKWETTMQNTYGYIRGTEGVDGDHIDVFLSDDIDGWNGRRVFVVDQYNEDGSFDEHKVMLGFNETDDAEAAYFANYDSDWAKKHKTVLTAVNLEDFEKWIDSSHRKTKAFAEYKSVKTKQEYKAFNDLLRDSDTAHPPYEGDVKMLLRLANKVLANGIKSIEYGLEEVTGSVSVNSSDKSKLDKYYYSNRNHTESGIDYSAYKGNISIVDEDNQTVYNFSYEPPQYKGKDAKLYVNVARIVGEEETTESIDTPYTITPAQYTTKRGKVLDMHLVKFNNELRDTVRKHTTMFAKQLKGWWDKEKQGFMMRSKEDAERLAEYATDAQSQPPLSLSDLSEVNDGNVQFAESQLLETSKQEEKQEYSPVWQYSVSVDKETGLTTLKRDDVSGPIPIGDGRFNYTANSPEEMLEIVRNPKNFNQELRDAVETILENKVKIREIVRTEKAEATEQESKPENNPNGNRLVTDERYAELRERMRKKLLGQMNMGIDPEILAIGTEMAVYHIEKGARKFAEYATAMIADLGDAIRPYLKAFYNGARDLPEVAENGLDADMTPYDEVQKFDVANFDKTSIDALATAETVTREAEVEQEAEIAQERIKKSRPARKKNGKKAVNSQQSNELNLFDSLTDNNKNNEHGLQRTDTERSERVLANGNRHEQGLSRGTETGSESEQQTDRGTDNKGEGAGNAVDRTVRPRLSDSLNEQSIEGKRKKEIESNRKLADELKGVTLHLNDKLGGEHEISGIAYYELANVFHCNDNISGPFQATRKEVDAILKVARKNDGRNTFTPKNTHNNHSERGKDHAPTSVDARIEANIKAIELAKQLIESGGQATEKQMQTLRKFSGWGGLGKAFSEGTYYAPNLIAKKLRELLGEKAYQEAVMSANSAYYTPAYVVDTLWDIAEKMGFEGGNILEGSAGIGNILGQMPTHISERSDIHAIEIDGTSGGILSLLYPDAKVEIQGFEQTRIPNGSVDLAITNVPFVTGLRVNDTTGDKDLSKKFHNIHDFCIAKNVRKLREGGLGIFITSNGTLDNSKKLRDWIVSEGGADFVGAFRMHNKTFGGTGVTSDIVVIRKRVNGQKSAHAIDVSDVSGERMAEYDTGETRKVKGKETPVIKQLSMDYNRYFIEHPENMAGEMHFAFEKGDTFRPTSKGLYPKQDKKQEEMLAEFVRSFSAEEFGERTTTTVAEVNGDKKVGEVFVKDGKLYINSTASAQPLEVNANKVKGHTKVECFEAYTAIKEALAEVLSYQTENESDEGLKPLLNKLNKAYDDFVSTYGHFNKNTAIAFLRNDVDYANVFALEKFEETADEKGNRIQKFDKTDVFSKRVVEKEKEPTPANVKDGIIASIFKFGRVDIPYIAEQLGIGIGEVKKEIIENGYGFENPVTRQMEASYQYLSGNIREKLRQAEENNENGEFDRNIKALQEVMPMEIPAHLIDFTLGSSWIDPKLYEDFVKERTEVGVRFTAVGGTWFMKEPYFTNYEKNRAMGVTSEMLGRTIMGHTLIEAAIQNRSITVSTTKKHYDGTTETITDKEATQACAARIDEIRQDFKDWARQKMQSDPEMSERMERIYNDMFNNFVPMSIPDEFVPEYFGGASHKFKMRPHQGKAIVRGTQQPLLLAHEVGTGKTFTLISTAMEMRRLGTARKPMIVVQNATVGQFVASAKELYPNAKILTLEEADRSAEGRKNFYAKIRYNDWDMIVVPQSTFEFIPDSEEREMAFVQDKIEEKMLILEKMKEEDPDGKNIITRQAEREIELLEEQLAGLADNASKKRTANDEKKRAVALQNAEVKAMEMLDRRTDDVENFDDMGIDALLVDEAHEYKHLGFATAMQRGVKGVDPSYSKKSQGVFLKTQAVLEKNNGRNVIFATGTPISNTAAEIWTFMRYLMPADTMKEYGIYYFDDFVRNFGNIQQMLEFTTSGKFKENNRFAGYVNLPELVRIWSGVSDTVLTKEAGGVRDKIPEMEGGKAQDLYLPQTRALRSIMKFVKSELEHYEQMSGKEKKENSHIPLTMYGIAKAAAVDARLVQSDAEDDPNSKTNEAVRQTLHSLKETADYKGTIAIFADNYQNKQSGFNLYDDIRNKLIVEGVPADEIVVMRSGMTVKKKLEIFEKVNRGEVRVILGSTFTLGTGVNIQERLHTLIHLDAPNRPMDYTQRNGRILRQGNLHKDMNKPVRILRFGVEDSLDVTAYQRLKTKGAIADSIMNGKQMMNNSMTNRVLEEEEDVFGDTVAQLSGSEYAMLKNNAEKNVRKYASRKKQWETDQTYIHNAKPRLKAFIKDAEKCIEDNSRYLDAVHSSFPDGQFKEIVIGKHRFASVDTMGDFFKEHNKSVIAEMKQMKDGEIAGEQKRELTIQIGDFSFVVTTKLTRQTMRDGATLFNDVERKMTYSCPELSIEDVPVRQNLLRNAIEDITVNVITGKDFAERLNAGEQNKKHNEAELKELLLREGKPFEYEEELAQAKSQLEEYAELMKKELEEKEAKYAEMDATVETANNISTAEEDDNVLYREDDLEEVNDRFNEELEKLTESNADKVILNLGTPSDILLSAGVSDKPMKLYGNKVIKKMKKHGFKLEELKNLPEAVANPIAVFENYGKEENRSVLTELKTEQGNFLVTLSVGRGNDIDFNVVTSIFGKGNNNIIDWIERGFANYINKEKALDYLHHSVLETEALSNPRLSSITKIVEKFENPNIADENMREGDGAYTDDEVGFENDPVAKLLGQSRRTAKQRRKFAQRERQRMAERVESLAKKLHLDNVEVVTDASVLEGRKQRAKGFYSKSTGKIAIVIPNHASTFDVEQTLLHEAVAHYGLRQLFGEHFDTFLDNVFNNADETIRRHIVNMAAKNGWDFRKATEEYLASLAEDTEFENINASWWQQIKDFFLNMLHKIGFEDFRGVTLSDNELRYILWRSYENLAEPGRYRNILGEAADVAKQYELKVGNYAVSDPHHQTVAESDDALYRTGDPEIHERELARDRYERRVKSGMFQSQEALQDSMLGLKEAMTAILGKETNIEDVDGFENAYLGENRLSSVNKAEADAFAHTLFKPMLDEVAKLARTEAEREELIDYMMAKHGLERNTYMRNEAINNGATDADQTDYAGLTALTGMDNVTDAETEAHIMVNDYEQAHDTTDLWKKINAASKAILSKSYECGMMSKATFDKISDMYDFYIPLRGFDEKTSSEAYAYLTHKQSAFNAPIKKAEGRRSKADDPFANLQSMAEGAIMQGNRNKLVKQRFLNFALNHPSDLVSVSDIWVEYDTVADEWKPVFPDNIDSTDTPEVVERKMLDFETKMESLAQQYPDRYKHGKDTVNIPYRIVESQDMRQHQIVVKRGGRDYVITINGNPRAAQALNGQTNPDNDMSGAIGAILRAGENINRQLSAFYTTRNPDFIVSNFMRDMLYTNTMTWIRESPNYALRFHRNYMYANPVRIKQLLAKHRKGTLDMGNKTEAMFHQFMMNGGETGYANIRDIEQHKNDIRRELKKSNGKIPVKKAWDWLGERFDECNRAVENCARFAAFMTSREMGRSIDRAIYDAKEISVNFNKKGSGAKFYDSTGQTKAGNASALVSGLGRSGYVFWNAAIQGTANFGRQMKRHPAKAFTGIAAMFLLGAIVAYLGGDDDDDDKNAYYNLPEYVRRSNILFKAGNSWVSIPLPVEYRAVYGMGELMISVLNGKEHLTGEEIAEAITGQATQILPIDFLEGGGGLNAFVPSAYKPLWEAYVAEKSWTGMPLYKDTPYNKDMPEWTKAYKSANKYIVGLANAMNEATGGDPYTKGTIDFNPAKVEYLLNGYFGGVFGTIDKMAKTAETISGAREYDPRSILLVNRLVKAGDERTEYRAVNNEYFRLKEEHDRLKTRLKHYEEDTENDIFDYAEKIDFLYNSPEYERYEIFEDYRRDIDDLYNELNDVVDDEERKSIESELNELKKEMIEEMNRTRKRK